MIIGAVISVYQYSTAYESALFGTTVSDDRLNALMQQYGITQTGDSYTDLKALYNAMYGEAESKATAASSNRQPGQPLTTDTKNVPWVNLMSQVGLSATGIVAVDYSAFNERLFTMQGAARTKQDEADIAALSAQANVVFNQQTQQTDITSTGSTRPQAISGADIVAQLNKTLLLG